jgi:hypothetical protein
LQKLRLSLEDRMRKLTLGVGIGIVTVGGLIACGEPFDISTTGGGTTTGTAGGPSASASGSSSASVSGSTSASSSSGSQGCTASSCGAPQYCDKATAKCVLCADYSTFTFSSAAQLTVPPTPLGGPSGTYQFPRVDALDLMYLTVVATAPGGVHLASAASQSSTTWGSPTYLLDPPNNTVSGSGTDVAALPVADGAMFQSLLTGMTLAGKPVLLFDSDRGGGSFRKVYLWPLGGSSTVGAMPLPVPMPGSMVGSSEYRIAVAYPLAAPASGRLWWVTDASATGTGTVSPRLVTALAGDKNFVEVPVSLASGCDAADPVEPWVTRDGAYLLFSAGCKSGDMTPHLFSAPLDATTGKPTAAAARVFTSDSGTDSAPSLRADSCSLLFMRGSEVFGASRQ